MLFLVESWMVVIDHVSTSICKRIPGLFIVRQKMVFSVYPVSYLEGKKFDTWTKKRRKFAVHNHAKNHLFAVEQAENVKTIISKPGVSIDDRLQQTKQFDVLRN